MSTVKSKTKRETMIESHGFNTPRGWRTLSLAIPRGLSDDVAAYIGRATTTVRRWREPVVNGSGEASFLDTFYAVSAALAHYHPAGLTKLENDMAAWCRRLRAQGDVEPANHIEAASEITRESADVVIALLEHRAPAEQERELVELIAAANAHLERIRAGKQPRLKEAGR